MDDYDDERMEEDEHDDVGAREVVLELSLLLELVVLVQEELLLHLGLLQVELLSALGGPRRCRLRGSRPPHPSRMRRLAPWRSRATEVQHDRKWVVWREGEVGAWLRGKHEVCQCRTPLAASH